MTKRAAFRYFNQKNRTYILVVAVATFIIPAISSGQTVNPTPATPQSKSEVPLVPPYPPSLILPRARPMLDCWSRHQGSRPADPRRPAILQFKVETDGSVKDVVIARSSGDTNYDLNAVDCVSLMRYTPAMQNGQPVEILWETQTTTTRSSKIFYAPPANVH